MTYINEPVKTLADFIKAAIRDFTRERRALPTRIVCNPTAAPSTWLAVSRMKLTQIEIVGDFDVRASELRLER